MEQNGRSLGVSPAITSELSRDNSFDVFEKDNPRSHCDDAVEDVRPEVARVFVRLPGAREAERLAGETGSEEINHSSKALHREGFKIRPKRGSANAPLFHARSQDAEGKLFDLRKSEVAQRAKHSLEPHSKA